MRFKSLICILGISLLSLPALAFVKHVWIAPILGHAEVSYVIVLEKGDCVKCDVKPLCKTDLDLYVYDVNGVLICKDTDSSPLACVAFRSDGCEEYKIVVKNCGSMNTTFQLTAQ